MWEKREEERSMEQNLLMQEEEGGGADQCQDEVETIICATAPQRGVNHTGNKQAVPP